MPYKPRILQGRIGNVDRINKDGNYEPGNCRWATMREQASNTRRNIIVIVEGEQMILARAVERLGLHYGTVVNRISRGKTPEQAINMGRA